MMDYTEFTLNFRQKKILNSLKQSETNPNQYHQISDTYDFIRLLLTFSNALLAGLGRMFLPAWFGYLGGVYLIDLFYEVFINEKPNKEIIEHRLVWSMTFIVSIISMFVFPVLVIPFYLLGFARDIFRNSQHLYHNLHDCDDLTQKLANKLVQTQDESQQEIIRQEIVLIQNKRKELKTEGAIHIAASAALLLSVGIVLITLFTLVPALPLTFVVVASATALAALVIPKIYETVKNNRDNHSKHSIDLEMTKPKLVSTNAHLFKGVFAERDLRQTDQPDVTPVNSGTANRSNQQNSSLTLPNEEPGVVPLSAAGDRSSIRLA